MHAFAAFVASDNICYFNTGSLINYMILSFSKRSLSSYFLIFSLYCNNKNKYSSVKWALLISNKSFSSSSDPSSCIYDSNPNFFLNCSLIFCIFSSSSGPKVYPWPTLFLFLNILASPFFTLSKKFEWNSLNFSGTGYSLFSRR